MDLGTIAGLILLALGAVGGLVLLGYTLDWTIRRHDDGDTTTATRSNSLLARLGDSRPPRT